MRGKDAAGVIIVVLGFIAFVVGLYGYAYVVQVTLYGYPIENLYPYREKAWAPILLGIITIFAGLFICAAEKIEPERIEAA